MIIGETFKSDYNGYGEENYDYLFKRKVSPARQQKKAEKKEKRVIKKQNKPLKRQDKRVGIIPKKRLIQGNFGMFNKNKRKEEAAKVAAASEAPDNIEAENTSLPTDETNPTPEAATPVENADTGESANENAETPAAPSEENNSGESEYDEYDEYDYDESAFDEPKEKAKPEAKESKSKGFGPALGYVFLGITIGLTVYALLSSDKKSKEILPPFKHAA